MKKLIIGILVGFVLLFMGFTIYHGDALRTDAYPWETIGESSTAYTTPAVNERDYTNLVANHSDAVVYEMTTFRYNNVGFRFSLDDNPVGADVVFDVFASKGQDYFTRICTLTLKAGLQVGPSVTGDTGVFADTLAVSNPNWPTAITAVDGAGGDRISSVWFDTNGFDTYAFVGTTVDETIKVQMTGH
jgi:hypothetical protein